MRMQKNTWVKSLIALFLKEEYIIERKICTNKIRIIGIKQRKGKVYKIKVLSKWKDFKPMKGVK